ncbi:20 kda chaperonin [Quercus suber]|uniref:20 kDa chaperonin n=1 Tax=Quercus suber TaxID=58331 RepID=A0AAW0JPN6_QUESU
MCHLTEVEFNGSKHLILKDDDIVGILESDDAKELKPLNDRVLFKIINIIVVDWCTTSVCTFKCGKHD